MLRNRAPYSNVLYAVTPDPVVLHNSLDLVFSD